MSFLKLLHFEKVAPYLVSKNRIFRMIFTEILEKYFLNLQKKLQKFLIPPGVLIFPEKNGFRNSRNLLQISFRFKKVVTTAVLDMFAPWCGRPLNGAQP